MKLTSKLVLGAAALTLAGSLGAAVAAEATSTTTAPLGMPAPAVKPGTPLADVQKPKETLMGVKVKDSNGEAVGEVKAVKLGPDGKVAAVDVKVGTRTFALKADTLLYAEADKTLISKQSKAEIQSTTSL